MYKTLIPGAIGTKPADLPQALTLAKLGGFTGLEVSAWQIAELVERDGVDAVKRLFTGAGIRPAGFGLPVEWRKGEEQWRTDLDKLPRLAKAAASIGVTRCATWVLPGSDELNWDRHWSQFVHRFTPIAKTLGEHGIALGLEFIGPKTLRDRFRFPFIHTMGGMLAIAREIGPNVGLLLDCWHWYTAHHTVDDLRRLRASDVVFVHVNDAPAGVDIDAQVDSVRALPAETGVIDIAGFLRALRDIGYDGPIGPEPFKKELADLPDDAARVKTVGAAMDEAWRRAGL